MNDDLLTLEFFFDSSFLVDPAVHDYFQLTQLYMTNDQNLTWVEWVEADTFLSADSGGHIQLHHFDLAKLTKKISKGKYEDKDEAKRSYNEHVPFGVYQVVPN